MVATATTFAVDVLLQYVVFFGKFWSEALEKNYLAHPRPEMFA